MKRRSAKRARQTGIYVREEEKFLEAHPFCQAWIFNERLDERFVLASGGIVEGVMVPRSTEVHHRNKKDGDRLLDQRWWLAVCRTQHDWIENHKNLARESGLLLPIQADKDGKWGSGNQGLTTEQLMAKYAQP